MAKTLGRSKLRKPQRSWEPIKAKSAPQFGGQLGDIVSMTTRGDYPKHEVIYTVVYKGKKFPRKLHSDGKTQWVMINNKPIQTNYPGRSTTANPFQ